MHKMLKNTIDLPKLSRCRLFVVSYNKESQNAGMLMLNRIYIKKDQSAKIYNISIVNKIKMGLKVLQSIKQGVQAVIFSNIFTHYQADKKEVTCVAEVLFRKHIIV